MKRRALGLPLLLVLPLVSRGAAALRPGVAPTAAAAARRAASAGAGRGRRGRGGARVAMAAEGASASEFVLAQELMERLGAEKSKLILPYKDDKYEGVMVDDGALPGA